MDLLNETPFRALIIVIIAILVDAILGATRAAQGGEFDLRELPRFLASHVLPYCGGLIVLAFVANYLPEPYSAVYYPALAAVLAKYVAEIKDKLADIFDLSI